MNKLLFGSRNKNKVALKDISSSQIKSGYLSDKSPKKKSNKYNVKYWVLTTTYLYSFNSGSENEKSVSSINIKQCKIVSEENSDEFTIQYGTDKKKEIVLKSDSMKEKTDWVDAIRLTISSSSEGNSNNTRMSSNFSDRRSHSVADIGHRSSNQSSSNNNSTQSQSSFVLFDLTSEKAIIRVYLADNSCKTLPVNVNDTVKDIINLMSKKLGGGNYDNFVIFEIRDIVSIKLDENIKLVEIFNRWPKNATFHTHRFVFQPEDSEQLKEASKIGELEVKTNANKYSTSSILTSSTGLKRRITDTLRKKSKKKGMIMLKDIKIFQKSGYIHKKNSAKYCILHDGHLYYFDNNKPDTMSSGIINLSTTTLFTGKGLSFTIYYTGEDKMKEFEAHCKTMDEKQIWLDTLTPLCNVVTNTPVKEKEDSVQNTNNNSQTLQKADTNESIAPSKQDAIHTEVNVNEPSSPSLNHNHIQTTQNSNELNNVNEEKPEIEDVKPNVSTRPKTSSNLPQLNTEFDHTIPHEHTSPNRQIKSPFMNKYSIPFSKMGRSPLSSSYSPSGSPFTSSTSPLQANIKNDEGTEPKEFTVELDDIDKLLEEAHSTLDEANNEPTSEPLSSNELLNKDQVNKVTFDQSNPIDIVNRNGPSVTNHSQTESPYSITPIDKSISNNVQTESPMSVAPMSTSQYGSPFSSSFTSNDNITYQSNDAETPLTDHVMVDLLDILNGNIQSPFDDNFMFPNDNEQQLPIDLLDGEFYFEEAD